MKPRRTKKAKPTPPPRNSPETNPPVTNAGASAPQTAGTAPASDRRRQFLAKAIPSIEQLAGLAATLIEKNEKPQAAVERAYSIWTAALEKLLALQKEAAKFEARLDWMDTVPKPKKLPMTYDEFYVNMMPHSRVEDRSKVVRAYQEAIRAAQHPSMKGFKSSPIIGSKTVYYVMADDFLSWQRKYRADVRHDRASKAARARKKKFAEGT